MFGKKFQFLSRKKKPGVPQRVNYETKRTEPSKKQVAPSKRQSEVGKVRRKSLNSRFTPEQKIRLKKFVASFPSNLEGVKNLMIKVNHMLDVIDKVTKENELVSNMINQDKIIIDPLSANAINQAADKMSRVMALSLREMGIEAQVKTNEKGTRIVRFKLNNKTYFANPILEQMGELK
ncbi:MAG: hypothetical protein PHQ98_01500 [Candidatus ainarchaeum sp.]|nr:hypothetical protein [Candidatus ainarchaeum sp.]